MINTNESDVRAGAPTAVFVTRGVVGWATSSKHFDVGPATSSGITRDTTLVFVTLESGRVVNSSKPPQAGKADGQEILCQVGGPLYAIPPKGTAVLIAFPDGMSDAPGAGVIMSWLGASPSVQFSATRAVLDVGGTMDLIIRAKSVTMTDYNQPARWLTVGPSPSGGPAGIMMCDEAGGLISLQSGVVGLVASANGDAKTLIQLTPTEGNFIQKDGSFVKLKGGNITTFGAKNTVAGQVLLGMAPVVGTPVLCGLTGIAGLPSASVFVSLT